MNHKIKSLLLFSFLFVGACVTINVYFPAAEVESAAEKIVKDVLGTQPEDATDDQSSELKFHHNNHWVSQLNPLNWLISSAHAQADITLSSPAINALTEKMKARYGESLKAYLDQNVVGFTNDGFVEIVDASQLALKDRQLAKKVEADENRDRTALYREMAIANNHPEWEEQIRQAFVKQWIQQAQAGWLYQNQAGDWVKK